MGTDVHIPLKGFTFKWIGGIIIMLIGSIIFWYTNNLSGAKHWILLVISVVIIGFGVFVFSRGNKEFRIFQKSIKEGLDLTNKNIKLQNKKLELEIKKLEEEFKKSK